MRISSALRTGPGTGGQEAAAWERGSTGPPPQPWGRRLNHKGKLAIPFTKLLSPKGGNPK